MARAPHSFSLRLPPLRGLTTSKSKETENYEDKQKDKDRDKERKRERQIQRETERDEDIGKCLSDLSMMFQYDESSQ